MGKFCGNIGFATSVETAPGVWEDLKVLRQYRGDVLKVSKKWQTSEGVNDNVNITNEISIIADSFINSNLASIKFIEWMGSNWKVHKIDVQRPRLILSIGGVYNE